MSLSNNKIDYSSFGGISADNEDSDNVQPVAQEEKVDYSQFGGKAVDAPKEKVGKFKSALLGLYEGTLAGPALLELGKNKFQEGQAKVISGFLPKENRPEIQQKENVLINHLGNLPESEGEAGRRIRAGASALPLSALGGLPGIVAGLVGSQAGQTIREVFGKEGKFDEFGWGEGAAIATDVIAGLGAGALTSLLKSGAKTVAQEAPSIFRNAESGLQKKVTRIALQSEEKGLQNIINDFSKGQLATFEEEAARISPRTFSDINESNAAALQRNAEQMFRNTELRMISPLEATPEQGGRAIQEAANDIFRNEVIPAERQAYTAAREAAEGLNGSAPRTLEQAKELRANLTRTEPTQEQKSVISYLDKLISDLEEGGTEAAQKSANDLIDIIQAANKEINYGSQFREQSHRLKPVIATLRDEVQNVLSQNPEAASLYRDANQLHARNAEIWGTKYMRNVRFTENPESIVGASKKASNLRNLKQAVQNETLQDLADRLVVGDLTQGGKPNKSAINNLNPELSPKARQAAQNLIDVKDPITNAGGRAAVRNQILMDAAQAVNTGKPPRKILELMENPKGYQLVKQSMNGSPESKELFKSFERLFLEDVMESMTTPDGVLDFKKVNQILKNDNLNKVLKEIGGDSLIQKFKNLEKYATNFEKNVNLYSKPETQQLFKIMAKDIRIGAPLAILLHQLHMPWPVIAGLGLIKTGASVGKSTYKALERKILSNPKAVHYLEQLSKATTPKDVAKQLPRLVKEIEKAEEKSES